jgi:archaellin
LSVILDSSTQDLEYQSNSSLDANETHYTVTYSIEGADYTSGYLSSGDVAVLKFVASSAIGESKYVRLSLVPKIGTPATIETQTPDIISRTRQIIFP